MALAIALPIIFLIDLMTNSCPISSWLELYTTIADKGLFNNPNLVSPCAHRFVVPILSGATAKLFGVRTLEGFQIFNYFSHICLLLAVFVFSKKMGGNRNNALIVLLAVALSMANIKNNLYFNFGMEPFCQALIIFFYLLLLEKRWLGALATACFGLCVRELFIIPSIGLVIERFCSSTSSKLFWRMLTPALFTAITLTVFVSIRLIIETKSSILLVDPFTQNQWLKLLLTVPLNPPRNLNIILGICFYLLPGFMLLTKARATSCLQSVQPHKRWLSSYTVMLLILTVYGGTDLYRYLSYLFLPLILVLTFCLQQTTQPVSKIEIVTMLCATLLFNRILDPLPSPITSLERYLDYFPCIESRINYATLMRVLQFGLCLLLAWCVRLFRPSSE